MMALKIINEAGMLHSTVYCDSQLVMNQYQGHFKVRDPSLINYKDKVQLLLIVIKESKLIINYCGWHMVKTMSQIL